MTGNRQWPGRKRDVRLFASSIAISLLVAGSPQASAQSRAERMVLPIRPAPFAGRITQDVQTSSPDWARQVKAPEGAPNIVVVMTDDVGFAAASPFGGPVPTPALDRLAQSGLRYNRFHTTGVCSPSRAALLTGRNHHMTGSGALVDMPSGFPGYSGQILPTAATIAQTLRLNGYNTAMFGKHHNVPGWEASAAGPFDRWPTGLGFEYFYGFIGGDTDQWRPALYRGVTRVEPPAHEGRDLLDKRLADDAIGWLHNQDAAAPDKPFFLYFAPGSAHAPHQAPAEWIARFRGRFDGGWDRLREETFARQKQMGIIPADATLTPRPREIQAWASLSPDERRVYARMMEVYAAMLAYQDAQFGRILDEIARMGKNENTIVIFVQGDNGGSAEAGNMGMTNEIGRIANGARDDIPWLVANMEVMGTDRIYQNYPAGWAWATNTPFQWTKQVASHLGGTRNGMVISWPRGIAARNEVRSQFSHLIDILPTLLDVAGIPAPRQVNGHDQQRIDGISLKQSFNGNADVPRTQYFELMGNRAIYKDGWMANTYPRRMPWEDQPSGNMEAGYRWELYDLNRDYSQSRNLAASQPARLREMQALFDSEAKRNQVYPIDDRFAHLRSRDAAIAHARPRLSYTYWGSDVSIMPAAAPDIAGRSFSISADVEVPAAGANGVLAAYGSWFGGWSLFLKDGYPHVVHAVSRRPEDIFVIKGTRAVTPGRHRIGFAFASAGGPRAGGTVSISVDGKPVGEGKVDRTIVIVAGLGETFDIGRDSGQPVTADYGPTDLPPDAIGKVMVELQERTPTARTEQ